MTGMIDMTITGTEIRLTGDKTCASWIKFDDQVGDSTWIEKITQSTAHH